MNFFGYSYKNTIIHNLNSITKLVIFLLWSILGMLTYNTYVLIFMLGISIIILVFSKIEYKKVSFVLWVMLIFLILNTISIYIFSPMQGSQIYGSITKITNFGNRYDLTYEQIFYEFNVFLKYLVTAPLAIIFVTCTNPTELACSLNLLGVPYSICYGLSLAFRYIPDIQKDFYIILKSKQARGIEIDKKVGLISKIKNILPIILSLLFSSLDRIDKISKAMQLREFGKYKKRTWYSYRKMQKKDYILLFIFLILFLLGIYITFRTGSRFYNPWR